MDIGRLNNRISLIYKEKIKDKSGGYKETDVEKAIVWAELTPLRGDKLVQAKQIQEKITYLIRIRYRTDIKSDWEIRFKTRKFKISHIINVNEANTMLEIYAEELV